MSQFNNKNTTPWNRNNSPNIVNQSNAIQSQMMNQGNLGNLNPSNMVPFQQQHQQVFQNLGLQQQNLGLGLQQMASSAMGAQLAQNSLFQQVGTVTYPNPRALNPTAFQTQPISAVSPGQNSSQSQGAKQRVFTGTVTKVHDNFGFVDEDVFFQTNACVKGSSPVVGDRVLVEATYNPSMPFKWNATRIQVLPMSNQMPTRPAHQSKNYNASSIGYNAVPPPAENSNGSFNRNNRPKVTVPRTRDRSRERLDRDRDDDELERKRRREERHREREKEERKSPIRKRSRSPKARRRSRIVPRYMVQIPKISLDLPKADVLEIRRRYTNLYIPSDFFFTQFRWIDAFPPSKPFSMNKPCSFHIMSKEVDQVTENTVILEPSDADYIFCAKVMLMSVPPMEEIYQKCCSMAEDRDRRDRDSEEKDFVHPTRLINFLVGLRGKNETMAIGGPWSKSLDGENPEKDPSVLIRTAIRTCKALTGVDLSSCTQWYRFVELYYRRNESTHKGKQYPARVETVVLFLPDVWSCLPTRLEWDNLHHSYRKQVELRLTDGVDAISSSAADEPAIAGDEKDEDQSLDGEPTPYHQLDPKSMSVVDLRKELKTRGINYKGLKSQLVARLSKVIKSEAEKAEDKEKEEERENVEKAKEVDAEADISEESKKEVKVEEKKGEEKKLDEREKAQLEKKYSLPDQPAIIVHPSKTAKSGKFDCTTMSLSLLLDYRPEDTKEHSFEVSLFAELFNEMLMRDYGFNIFKALYELPEKLKVKEKDDKRKKEDDNKKGEGEKKNDDKKKDDDKKKEGKKKDEPRKDEDKQDEEIKKEGERKIEDEKVDRKSDRERKKDDHEKRDNKRDIKKEERRSDESEEEDEDDDDSKDRKKDRRRRERVKMFTKDKQLLLSFVYFDQTHCGYIFDKDIEDLLYTLGLNLSRAQVRKLVSKVVTRESLHYRKLTDKPKDEEVVIIDEIEKDNDLEQLAVGNKTLLPVFEDDNIPAKRRKIDHNLGEKETGEGLVTFQGALVDVGKLMHQLERSEKARMETEARMVELKNENNRLYEKYNKSNSVIKTLSSEVKESKDKLKTVEESLSYVSVNSKIFQATLQEIKDKIDPVLKIAIIKEDPKLENEREKRHEESKESKSRWEKDIKKQPMVLLENFDTNESNDM